MPRFIYDIIPPEIKKRVAAATQEVSKWIKVLRMFLKTSKYGTAILIIAVVSFAALLVFAFQPKTEIVEIFPTQYRVETWSEELASESHEIAPEPQGYGASWQNGEKALQRELDKKATLAEFSSENSAVLFLRETEEVIEGEEMLEEGEVLGASEEEIASPSEAEIPEIEEPPLAPEEASESEEVVGEEQTLEEPKPEEEQTSFPHLPEIEDISEEIEPEPEPEPPTPSEEGEGQAEPEEIPEGIGGCEFCEDETPLDTEDLTGQELATDAEDLLNLMEEIEEEASISQPPLSSYSIIFSGFDFNASDSFGTFKKAKLTFSFGAEEREGNDVLLVEYKIPLESEATEQAEKWKTLTIIQLNKEKSNASNNGYWQKEISDINSWDGISNLEAKFTIQSFGSQNKPAIYLDAIWLEVEYNKPEETRKLE